MSAEEIDEVLPEGLAQFAAVVGREGALAIARRVGGLQGVYIPKGPDGAKRHPIAEVLTPEQWRALCLRFGGRRLEVPRAHFLKLKKARILELLAEGYSQREIAIRAGVTQRYVKMVAADLADDRQLRLFG